jgi:tetratricopeptide (TPR) repeat protein
MTMESVRAGAYNPGIESRVSMMKTKFKDKLYIALLAAALMVLSSGSYAAGGNYSSDVDLEPFIKLIEQGNYKAAIDKLYDQLDRDPDNADIMSLLGYSHRKIRNFEDALTFYQWALRAEPDHVGANEYLGELYLETNQLDKAVEQLQKLDNLCGFNCKEYSRLKNMIDMFQGSASNS